MLIYHARPHDDAADSRSRVHTLVREVERAARSHPSVALYDPIAPWHAPWAASHQVRHINDFAEGMSVGMVAVLPSGVPSVGVPMEIQQAAQAGKPVHVIGSENSLQLATMQNVAVYAETDVRDAIVELVPKAQAFEDRLRETVAYEEPMPTIKWSGSEEYQPRMGYDGDAGYDLIVSERTVVRPGAFVDVPCGIDAIELPPGTWAMVTGRSSTLRRRRLLVAQGVIDNGYRGPIYAGVENLGAAVVIVERGERLAQMILFDATSARCGLRRVDTVSASERGASGFGSTGT